MIRSRLLPTAAATAAALTLLATPTAGARAAARTAACDAVVLPFPDIASLHPALTEDWAQVAGTLLYTPLATADASGAIDWPDSLASAIRANADDTRFTVTLRPWRWSDSTQVTAADVLYDWSLIKAQGESWPLYGVGGIPDAVRSVAAPDPHTVVVTLTRPINPRAFEANGLGVLAALPSRDWSRHTLAQQEILQSGSALYHVSDGPYRMVSNASLRAAVFEPNPLYGGTDRATARLILDFAANGNPLEALRQGVVDVATLPLQLTAVLSRLPGFTATPLPTGSVDVLFVDYWDPAYAFLDDAHVRAAIGLAIDQRRLIQTAFHGYALPQRGIIPAAQPNFIPPDLQPILGNPAPDPSAARRLLDAAGWTVGPDGVRRRDGRRLAIGMLVPSGDPARATEAELIQDDLARVGVSVSLRELDRSQLSARIFGHRPGWGLILGEFGMGSYPDVGPVLASAPKGFLGYKNAEMDALLDKVDRSDDPASLYALERYAYEQQPAIFLPEREDLYLARTGTRGIAATYAAAFLPTELVRAPSPCG